MNREMMDLFAAQVPRYTSYPTAPHFHTGIDEISYRRWLADIPAQAPLSLYLHVPFCDTLCWFCGCHTSVVNQYAPVRRYCYHLLKEMALVAQALGSRRRVQHIHWGGGSPTMLQPGDIEHIHDVLKSQFDIMPGAELAVEIDPRGLTQDCVDAFARAGLTRASIGVQDCDPAVQKAINRIQSPEETSHAITMLRRAGVSGINLDLLYGLPLQTPQSWEKTLRFALDLQPDRLAVFGYAHMPSFKKHQALIKTEQLPDLETRLRLAEMAAQILTRHGYVSIGLDHFAKPDDSMARAAANQGLSRNFQGYTTDKAPVLIGLGASAIGALPQGYVQNLLNVSDYRAAVDQGRLPIARGIALTPEDRLRRQVIERLMCDLHADLNAICEAFGQPASILDTALSQLAPLMEIGAVTAKQGHVRIRPEWRSAARLVCAAFDTYLKKGTAKHSVSV
jgi:oxygen-independent coproporphyrinogen-3 oxidase